MQKYETIKNLGPIFYQKTKDFVLTFYALNIFLIRIPYFSTNSIHPPLHRFTNFSLLSTSNSLTKYALDLGRPHLFPNPTYLKLYIFISQQSQKSIFIFRFVIFYAVKNLYRYYYNVSSKTYIIVFSLLSSLFITRIGSIEGRQK